MHYGSKSSVLETMDYVPKYLLRTIYGIVVNAKWPGMLVDGLTFDFMLKKAHKEAV